MKRRIHDTYHLIRAFGFDPRKMVRGLRGLPTYFLEWRLLERQRNSSARIFSRGRPYPCLDDRYEQGGMTSGHYFYQDLVVARRIFANNPTRHVDIGSRVDGFVAHVASFRPIRVIDIRPLRGNVPNVEFVQADMMGDLSDDLVDYCDSLSCLHAIEHFGLGRYGDPIKYDGYLLGLRNIRKMLQRRGKFYLSVPIGDQRIEFNAHRIFDVDYVLELLKGAYNLDGFSFVDDQGQLHADVNPGDVQGKGNFGCEYGCGIFELTKL